MVEGKRGVSDHMALFEQKAVAYFSFLTDKYKMRLKVDRRPTWINVKYSGSASTIRISYEARENLILTHLIKGKEINELGKYGVDWFYLQDVIRAKQLPYDIQFQKPIGDRFTPDELNTILAQSADIVREYCQDILQGDLSQSSSTISETSR
jgi:hypothetical protein